MQYLVGRSDGVQISCSCRHQIAWLWMDRVTASWYAPRLLIWSRCNAGNTWLTHHTKSGNVTFLQFWWCMTPCLSHFWLLTPQLTHSLTKHADWCAYSYVLIPCLLIDYKAPIVLLQIPYKACFFPPFLFEILCFPHVYKAPGAHRSPGGIPPSIAWNYLSPRTSLSVSPLFFESCRLQWRSKGFSIQF